MSVDNNEILSDEDFLKCLKDSIATGTEQYLAYKDFSFLFEPYGNGSVIIWQYGVCLGDFKTFDDFYNKICNSSSIDISDKAQCEKFKNSLKYLWELR